MRLTIPSRATRPNSLPLKILPLSYCSPGIICGFPAKSMIPEISRGEGVPYAQQFFTDATSSRPGDSATKHEDKDEHTNGTAADPAKAARNLQRIFSF